MAQDEDLPEDALRYRFKTEINIISHWLDEAPPSASVLDLGCGGGAWSEYFSTRYRSVVGIEGSSSMAQSARTRTSSCGNVDILEADARAELPEGKFHLVFLGGLSMYLNDPDLIDLLKRIKERLSPEGMVILRESTVPQTARAATGSYGALYRTPEDYQKLFLQAGFPRAQSRRNLGYTAMETAIEMVNARRKLLPFLPRRSPLLGAMTWWSLRLIAPLSFKAVPLVVDRLNITWPTLQNHFFRLKS